MCLYACRGLLVWPYWTVASPISHGFNTLCAYKSLLMVSGSGVMGAMSAWKATGRFWSVGYTGEKYSYLGAS